MEENEVIKEIEHDDKCFWSYIGAIVGGIIGAIPWMLVYSVFSFNFAILTMFIPIASLSGYKFLKGTVNTKTLKTIIVISIIIFSLTLYYFFPFFISQNKNIPFNDFKSSIEYDKYSKDILENTIVEIFFAIIGIVIVYTEISKLLNRYKATNGMIKDSNLFIRRDDNPIDSEDYNGIKFSDEQRSPLNSAKIKFDNNYKNIKENTYNKIKMNNKSYTAIIILIVSMIVVCRVLITLYQIYDDNKDVIDNIIEEYNSNEININNDTNDDFNYDNEYDYGNNNNYDIEQFNNIENSFNNYDEYVFERENIKLTLPENWKIIDKYDDVLYLTNDNDYNGYIKSLAIYDIGDNNNDLYEYHKEVYRDNINIENEVDPTFINLNGNEAYYSFGEYDNGFNYVLYTMKYRNYYIVLLDYETDDYNFYDCNALLRNISDAY